MSGGRERDEDAAAFRVADGLTALNGAYGPEPVTEGYPPGLRRDPDSVIRGTPTRAGTYRLPDLCVPIKVVPAGR